VIGIAILVALMAGMLISGTAAAANRPITFRLYTGDWCLRGYASDGATVKYKIKDASGQLKDQGTTQASDVTGSFYSDCPDYYPGWGIEPGYQITASDGHSTRKFVIPDLRMYVNRVTDAAWGIAPAGSDLLLDYLWPAYSGWEILIHERHVTADENGRFRLDLHKHYWIDGGDGVGAEWTSPQGDTVSFGADAPHVTVTLGKSDFYGEARMYSTATTTLTDSSTHEFLASASVDVGFQQGFTGTFRDADGNRHAVAPGDRLKSNVASDAAFIVPDIEATGDAATDTVTGRCYQTDHSTQGMHIGVYRTGIRRGYVYAGTESDGTFSYHFEKNDFPDPAVLKHGDKLLIRCFQVNGDIVQKWVIVP